MKTKTQIIETSAAAKANILCRVLAIATLAMLPAGQALSRPGAGVGGAASGGARGAGIGGAGAGPGHVGGAAGGAGFGARGVGVAPGAGIGSPGVGVLPRGYYAAVPAGRTVVYRGYTCRYVNGVYYRPVMYQGYTVWVVV